MPVIFISAFAAFFLIQAIAATALFLLPTPAQAANPPFILEVPIGSFASVPMGNSTKPIAQYIQAIYNYAVGAVGIVAAVVLMIGGVMWITAGGNTSNVSEAKSMITAALTGMVLVLVSYLMLDQINPALVDLQADIIGTPTPIPLSTTLSCSWTNVGKSSNLGGATGGTGSFSAGQQGTTVVGNCSDKGMTESVGGKDCDASKYPTDFTYTKCCCQTVAAPAGGAAGCTDCVTLTDTAGMCSSQASYCETNKILADKLKTAFANSTGLNWYITSGFRTDAIGGNSNSNHLTGNAVDISMSDIKTLSKAQALYTSLSTYLGASKVHLECSDSSDCCNSYPNTNCRYVSWAEAVHFHVDK